MCLKSLPFMFINMEGEMLYILEQRLSAQNVPLIKAQKVLNDIISTMLNDDFVRELFRPQELYSKGALKITFDKLAHASIMRLNSSSVDKLYDLISMAFKYQLYMCPRPSDLLLITLNHVDALRRMVNLEHIKDKIDELYHLFMQTYLNTSEGEYQQIRFSLLNFFQDTHIRVSMFLKDKSQNPDGRFALSTVGQVPVGTEIPGSIRLFNSNGDIFKIKHFQNSGRYQPASKPVTIALIGDRGTSLGTNMYNSYKTENEPEVPTPTTVDTSELPRTLENSTAAKTELNFLAELIGSNEVPNDNVEFRLHLFDISSERDSEANNDTAGKNVLMVSPEQDNEELSKIMETLQMDEATNEIDCDDLLHLMDSTCK